MGDWLVVFGYVGEQLQSHAYPNWEDADTGAEFEYWSAVHAGHIGKLCIIAIVNPKGIVTEARSYCAELPDDKHSLVEDN